MSKKKPRIEIASEEEVTQYARPAESSKVEQAGEEQEASSQTDAVKDAEAQISQWKEKLLRTKADYQNLLNRSAKERREAVRFANADFARSLLTVIDDFERTFEAAKTAESVGAVVEGLRIVYDHLLKLLRDHGVEPIEAEDRKFDPFEHEAMAQQPSDECPAGMVLSVQRRGYRMHERVLRPAGVIVSAGDGGEPSQADTQSTPGPEEGN
ncbi:MAG TPA: nucleotide exchange factor GrpE [Phycisphaerae bacterium]|nr:nucleotide exchange factor GrpE [Phycisphaerae bacterium]